MKAEWYWVTHILALLFCIVLLGLLGYTVVAVKDLEAAKGLMGFSSGILGVILAHYFNRERLEKETREREYFSRQADQYWEARSYLEYLKRAIEEEPEE